MASDFSFSQLLRPVGQMLEALDVESLSLRVEDTGVSVRAQKRPERQTAGANISLHVTWQIFRRKKSAVAPQPSSGVLELHYSHDDIMRMDSQAQAQRKGTSGSPEAHTLSQILRAVGAFVDQKQGRLLGVTIEGQDIAIDYESALKKNVTEKFTVSSLYDYWVKMYLRRRERN
ncbi:MAG TPA: hypothetical protein VH985_05790 [Candidatus Binatia bacterium]|jgi:hypothetical protein